MGILIFKGLTVQCLYKSFGVIGLTNSYLQFQKIEGRVASDEDLKLSDTLRYYMRDSFAAKRLLYRRLRCLSNYEQANRLLEKARSKNKDVHAVSVILFRWFILKFGIMK
jgi:hypothetical protein